MIFSSRLIYKCAPTFRPNSKENPVISIQVYRYTLMVYRYTFSTAHFLLRCTGTLLGCIGTLCPLPLFQQGVPVHFSGVPVHFAHWCFSSIAEVPETSSIVFPHPHDLYWLPEHKSLYTYALDLKGLHKSNNTKAIKSTYPHAKCG